MPPVDELADAERRLLQVAAASNDPAVWLRLGATQHALGKLESASRAFRRAMELGPQSPQPYCALATVLWALARPSEAEAVLRQAPEDAQVHFNLGVLLEQRGQALDAREQYERALHLAPQHAGARINLGASKLDGGDPEGALREFDAVICVAPSADAHANRARALLALFRDEEALEAAQAAIALDPGHKRALLERVAALASLGRVEEADTLMPPQDEVQAELRARGFARAPRALELYFARAFERQAVCDWRDRDSLVERLRATMDSRNASELWDAGMMFNALGLPLSASEQRRLAERAADGLPAGHAPYAGHKRQAARRRIGFLSANVAQHPEGYLMRRVLRDLDRREWEVRLYGLNPRDASRLAEEMRRSVDAFHDLSSLSTPQAIAVLRGEQLDLLVETSGYLQGTRPGILKARVAPVQASYLSIAATLGSGLVDYRISDEWTTQRESQVDWSERLVLVPPPHFAYDNEILRGPSGSRADHGLPPTSTVLCCMNQAFKIEPEGFAIWMRVLQAAPEAVLWLLDNGPHVRGNLQREAQARGVAPQRLIFAPRVPLAAHLGRLAHADLFLDTLHFNAHTTALDALWAGLPVLSRSGTTMASRLGSVFVRAAGLEDLAVADSGQYERKALELARRPDALRALKARLTRELARGALFDTPARVGALARAFRTMIERHRAGLPPDTLIID